MAQPGISDLLAQRLDGGVTLTTAQREVVDPEGNV
jgi:hypothetical protein